MIDNTLLRKELGEFIPRLNSVKDIYALFGKLNYPKGILLEPGSKRKKADFDFSKEEGGKVKEIYSILSFKENIPVFLLETTTIHPAFVRYITKVFTDRHIRFLLILTIDYDEIIFVLPDYEKKETGSHKLKITKLVIDREHPHYTDIDTLAKLYYSGSEATWRDVWKKWRDAFNIEKVTEEFFEDYKSIFFRIRDSFIKQKISRKDSHEFTLQFLNRIMFIYFIAKKGWLNEVKFVNWLWKSYLEDRNKGNCKKDCFYEVWLRQIFFKAFNNRASEVKDLPKNVKETLLDFPYLNGGLFSETKLDSLKVSIPDTTFKYILDDFFEKYNFTIKEDMPLDSEVAVDPQMLGYVYESLANVAEEIYDRNDLGIFYTPRVEVDFMCRRTLVEYLFNHLTDIPKDKLYELVFDPYDNKEKTEKYFSDKKLWQKLENTLDNLSAVDPACGSGAFLVGMQNVLVGLYRIIYKYNKRTLSDFELKNRIVGRSLYGVDVMPWAIHAAELRLWLQLIIETEFSREELRKHPLLPNLNMNLRIGDSLVQEIGGVNLHLRRAEITDNLKKRLNDLKIEKQNYFNNVPAAKFKTKEEIIAEETKIFEDIISERIEFIDKKVIEIKRTPKQMNLFGESAEDKDEEEKKQSKIEELLKEKSELKGIIAILDDPEKRPFVWDIDFAEIFGDKSGFDIVIGNPPYVRQEKISPPNKTKAEVKLEDKQAYKDKLINSVKAQFSVVESIDKQSDYYVYFYFHGLGLLNEKGTFCFITSNSWLDVEYGKDLQEFLLKYVPILAIYDNPKRSFAHADINTIISLFGASKTNGERKFVFGHDRRENWLQIENTAKFVMFRRPFEEVLTAKNLNDIEDVEIKVKNTEITELVKNVVKTSDYRLFPVIQNDLLEDGWEYPEGYNIEKGRFRVGRYDGNKWASIFFRMPDIIYHLMLQKEKPFIKLSSLVKFDYGNKPGISEFFLLSKERIQEFGIEREFLREIVTSTHEIETYMISPPKIQLRAFVCNESKGILKKTGKQGALKYIEWGEKQKTTKKGAHTISGVLWKNVPSVKNNTPFWYSFNTKKPGNFIIPRLIRERFFFAINKNKILDSDMFYHGIFRDEKFDEVGDGIINSTFTYLFLEIYGRHNIPGRFNVYGLELKNLLVPNFINFSEKIRSQIAVCFNKLSKRNVEKIFDEIGINSTKPIREQEPKPLSERAELDKVVFDALGLSEDERKEVYWSVCELVKQRLDKAKSLKSDTDL